MMADRLLGIDPGLRRTGWGVIDSEGPLLRYVASGVIMPRADLEFADRLKALYEGLLRVLDDYGVDEAAVEETFVNVNPSSTLKLGMARGVAMLAPAVRGAEVFEYAPNLVKKSLVGNGHASKEQISAMIKYLLPKAPDPKQDESDALAVAVCHAHHRGIRLRGRKAS